MTTTPPAPRRGLRWTLVAVIVVSWSIVGLEQLLQPATPQLTTRGLDAVIDAGGAPRVRVDGTALAAWCRVHDLPDPPPLGELEPPVASALDTALTAAARGGGAALGHLGMVYESLDCHPQAVACFERASAADPSDPLWPYYLGCIHQLAGRTQPAVAQLQRALELDPAYPVTHARLAQLFIEMGDLEAAERHADAYVTARPNDALGYVHAARIALARGQGAAALEHATLALQRGRPDFQVHHVLARSFAAVGRTAEAERHYAICNRMPQGMWFAMRDPRDQALGATTNSVAHLMKQFEALRESGDWARLIGLAERIIERRPQDALMLGNLATLYRKVGQLDDALATLERIARLDPELVIIDERRAEILLTQRDYAGALDAADRALERSPSSLSALSTRGRARLMLGRVSDAIADLEVCRRRAPDRPAHLVGLAEAYWAANRLDDAESTYRAVLDMVPGHPQATRRLGDIAQRRGDP